MSDSTLERFAETYMRLIKLDSAAATLRQCNATADEEAVVAESRRIHDKELMPMLEGIDLKTLAQQYLDGLISKPEFIAAVQLPSEK